MAVCQNPNRLQHDYQYQWCLPAPADILSCTCPLRRGVRSGKNDIRFVEDDWESPTLGAWGLGWEVWLDGMEITQFTYFQQVGGIDLSPISVELTYGIERSRHSGRRTCTTSSDAGVSTATYTSDRTEFSKYNRDGRRPDALPPFDAFEAECRAQLDAGLAPAYEFCLKCSHVQPAEARGAISVTERTGTIARVRALAGRCARAYLDGVEPRQEAEPAEAAPAR
jgi:glycyl-tRNA synthetase alpha chain